MEQRREVEIREVEDLRPNPLCPWTREHDAELEESIRQQGLLQPLLVTPSGTIVAGHRRWLALRKAGVAVVPVLVREMDEAEQILAMLAENLQRHTLNPVETAMGCGALRGRGLSAEQIASKSGLSPNTVRQHLAVLELPQAVQEQIATWKLAIGAAQHLARLPTAELQLAIGMKAAERGWLIVEVSTAVHQALEDGGRTAEPAAPRRVPRSRPSAPAARAHSSSCESTAPPAPAGPRTTEAKVRHATDLLCELVRLVRETPSLVLNPSVQGWLQELAAAVRKAQDSRLP